MLTDWETAHRTGKLPDHIAALYADPDTTVPDLLDAVPDHQADELVELAIRPHCAGVLARFAPGDLRAGVRRALADGDLQMPPPATDPTAGGGMGTGLRSRTLAALMIRPLLALPPRGTPDACRARVKIRL